MSNIIQYFPKSYYLLTDFLLLDLGIVFLFSFIIFLCTMSIILNKRRYANSER